jgi:hypothetical protein
MVFSADEGADVGADEGTAVSHAYAVPFHFTGKIGKVTIELTDAEEVSVGERCRRAHSDTRCELFRPGSRRGSSCSR